MGPLYEQDIQNRSHPRAEPPAIRSKVKGKSKERENYPS